MFSIVVLLLILWAIIYALYYIIRPTQQPSLLPTLSTSSRRSLDSTQLVLNKFHLRVQTTSWNLRHDILSTTLARKQHLMLKTSLQHVYDAGSILGVIGMLGAVGLLLWTTGQLSSSTARLIHDFFEGPSTNNTLLAPIKRSLDLDVKGTTRSGPVLRPIIPGVTVPLAHLPMVLLAVFLSQVIHELGHAISAALESIPILHAGASFFIFLPSAFVTFPLTALESLPPLRRLRIIAAGPFHNIMFWSLILLASQIGLGSVLVSISGYKDVSKFGRVVVRVDDNSPLRGHLLPGSLITKLDDTALGPGTDIWTSYLTGSPNQLELIGWCFSKAEFLESPQSCCNKAEDDVTNLPCFISLDTPFEKHCVNPVPLLTYSNTEYRCTSTRDCSPNTSCILPDPSEHLLRLNIQPPPWITTLKTDQIVLWSGPFKEIYEQVTVGVFVPRISYLPLWLPDSVQTFFQYLNMASLSLYLFNLLPLPLLDGAQLLDAGLDWLFDGSVAVGQGGIDLGMLESGMMIRSPRNKAWKRALQCLIPMTTSVVFGLCILLALINIG